MARFEEEGDGIVVEGNGERYDEPAGAANASASSKRRGYEPVTLVGDDHNNTNMDDNAPEDDMAGSSTLSMDEAVEQIGFGIFQIRILIATGLCFAADAMQVVCLTFLTPILKNEWKLTTDEAASLASSLFAGAMVGTLCLGPLADAIGRRPVFAYVQ